MERPSREILVIRPGAIGDTLLAFPLLSALQAASPLARLTLVGNAQVLPLARWLGVADQVEDYADLRWSALFAESGPGKDELCARLRLAERVICWLTDSTGVVRRTLAEAGVRLATVAPGRPPMGEPMHVTAYLAQTLGLPFDLATAENRCYRLPPAILEQEPRLFDTAPLVVHPGSGSPTKCWPASRFAAVISWAWEQGWPVLLLAGPADHEQLAAVVRALPSPGPNRIKVLIDLPLLKVATQIQRARCYLGNDSGLSHLAGLLGVPTVTLFGPTDPAVWRPLGPAVVTVRAQPLDQLAVEVVLQHIEQLLSAR
ncbi:glycosyltransferase family 9 protein [Thermogemmatispora sp.]|uniref:glycosyltransferase family 9 protein n=1 Tax=Thermogemmatispora sp. TaxID=1968838 RepID=UPI002ACC265A|nr:glycosyltransferase family 9 protein [Thermogemmatispora sp.]